MTYKDLGACNGAKVKKPASNLILLVTHLDLQKPPVQANGWLYQAQSSNIQLAIVNQIEKKYVPTLTGKIYRRFIACVTLIFLLLLLLRSGYVCDDKCQSRMPPLLWSRWKTTRWSV